HAVAADFLPGTIQVGLDVAPAHRALVWRLDWPGIFWPQLQNHTYDLRNDFACFLDDDSIAELHVLSAKLAEVVQRGMLHRGACELHRLELRPRREFTRL